MLLHVSIYQPSSGRLLLCFAKVIIIKFNYFNGYNFSKAQTISSPMMVVKPKHVGEL